VASCSYIVYRVSKVYSEEGRNQESAAVSASFSTQFLSSSQSSQTRAQLARRKSIRQLSSLTSLLAHSYPNFDWASRLDFRLFQCWGCFCEVTKNDNNKRTPVHHTFGPLKVRELQPDLSISPLSILGPAHSHRTPSSRPGSGISHVCSMRLLHLGTGRGADDKGSRNVQSVSFRFIKSKH